MIMPPINKIQTVSFVENYIECLAKYILEHYSNVNNDFSRLAVCFGGKRPGLFLKRELARRLEVSFFPPQLFTIDNFVKTIVKKNEDFISVQDLDNCYLIYEIVKKEANHLLKKRESFAQFLPWSREILGLIEQLDLENINSSSLKTIKANAEIGYEVPEDINELLKSVVVIRSSYHQQLLTQKMYSRGFQYLRASQLVEGVLFDEFDQVLFCNFFYLNRTEEKIVKSFYEKDKARFLFQGDQRKWPVLEHMAKRLDCSIVEGENPDPTTFDLKLYEGGDVHSQMGLIREVLGSIDDLSRTVIVLPDVKNMIVLLTQLSGLAEEFNVSMGYPLKRSSLYVLFDLIFKAQISQKSRGYYTKDYLKILRHPFVKNLKVTDNPAITRILIHKIEEILTGKERSDISGSLFIDLKDLEELEVLFDLTKNMLERLDVKVSVKQLANVLKEIHELFFVRFSQVDTLKTFAQQLEHCLEELLSKSFMQNYPLNVNIAEKMLSIKDEFLSAKFNQELFDQEEIFKIFDTKVSGEIVAFLGAPLKGLQVLGLFETRSLNFENVIVMDVNEGVLPYLKIYEPLIPREVMISLNLDRLELEEEIQRYQFMRLISSAKNVHLIYQKSKEKERSRFVEELIWEKQKQTKILDVYPVLRSGFNVQVNSAQKFVKKTPRIMEALRKHVYSASSINLYLRDPMEFYMAYCLGLREKENLLEEPEARHVGTFIHRLLENAFKPFLGKKPIIDADFRHQFLGKFEDLFDQTFLKTMHSDAFLLKAVIKARLERFLENEAESHDRQVEEILYLEKSFPDTINLSCGAIQFSYIIDRIDRMKNGTVMIVDYKTGSRDLMPSKIEEIVSMDPSCENIIQRVKSFQLPLYFHYLHKEFKNTPINAAFYNLRTLKLSKLIDSKSKLDYKAIDEAFLKCLDFIVSEILNPEIDFVEGG